MPANGDRGVGPPPKTRRRGPVTGRALAKGTTSHQANFSRTVFDPQHLAEFAGYVVLAWCEDVAAGGTKLGSAMVRLPNVADIDLVVTLHCDGGRLWAEAVSDTPRRCRRRLERVLPLLATLVVRGIGPEAFGTLLRQRADLERQR